MEFFDSAGWSISILARKFQQKNTKKNKKIKKDRIFLLFFRIFFGIFSLFFSYFFAPGKSPAILRRKKRQKKSTSEKNQKKSWFPFPFFFSAESSDRRLYGSRRVQTSELEVAVFSLVFLLLLFPSSSSSPSSSALFSLFSFLFLIFPFWTRFSLETNSKNSFSMSNCTGSDPGIIPKLPGELEKLGY